MCPRRTRRPLAIPKNAPGRAQTFEIDMAGVLLNSLKVAASTEGGDAPRAQGATTENTESI